MPKDNNKQPCPACNGISKIIFKKQGYDYYECVDCKTIFVPGGIDQSGMVGGGNEVERNLVQNGTRIERFIHLTGVYGRILDFGCGHSYLVKDCKEAGLNAEGYDKFNPECDQLPKGKFNICSMVEVIEHTHSPFAELDLIRGKLVIGGIVYIETSFTDISIEENIPLEEYYYINGDVGHCTIFSHKGLNILMEKKGFNILEPIDRNVRLFQKK